MAAFDATVGGSAATSLVTVATADDIFAVRPASDWWTLLTTAEKQVLLMQGTARAEVVRWRGRRTSPSQALSFPRTGCTSRDGEALDSETIPLDVARGVCEIAADYRAKSVSGADPRAANALAQFSDVSVDVVSITLRDPDTAPAIDELPVSARRAFGYLMAEGAMFGRVVR